MQYKTKFSMTFHSHVHLQIARAWDAAVECPFARQRRMESAESSAEQATSGKESIAMSAVQSTRRHHAKNVAKASATSALLDTDWTEVTSSAGHAAAHRTGATG